MSQRESDGTPAIVLCIVLGILSICWGVWMMVQ